MNLQVKIWWLIPAVALGSGLLYFGIIHLGIDASWQFALRESILFSILLWLCFSLLWVLLRLYPIRAAIIGYALVAGFVAGLFAVQAHSLVELLMLHRNGNQLSNVNFETLKLLRACQYFSIILIYSVALAVFRRMDELEKRYSLQQDAASLLREAELARLRQQLQPHFLYNSLNAVSALIRIDPEKADSMVHRLSDFLRSSVRQGQSERVVLSEEIEFLRNYLWIEAVRFGSRLQVEWQGIEPIPQAHLPPFLLQPLMENAIRYGLYGNTGTVRIQLAVEQNGNMLQLSIRNPYDADTRPSGGTGFGLEGVRRRLYLTYGRQDLLRTQSQEGNFEVTIQIPQEI